MAIANFEQTGPALAGGNMPFSITVYTLPFCARSIATVRALCRLGVVFEEIDLSLNAQARAHVQALGYMRAPVVVAGETHWAGHNPEAIGKIAAGKPHSRPCANYRMIDAAALQR